MATLADLIEQHQKDKLTATEQHLLQYAINGFRSLASDGKGKAAAVKAKDIAKALQQRAPHGTKVTERLVRKLVHHIRVNNLVSHSGKTYIILAGSSGYWIAKEQQEVREYLARIGKLLS